MNKEKLFESFSKIAPVLIEESDQYEGEKMKSNKISAWKKFALTAAAVLAVLIVTPNISPAAAKALAKVPVIGSVVKVFTFRKYEDSTEHTQIDLDVPCITIDETPEMTAAPDEQIKNDTENQINADIEQTAQKMMDEYRETLEKEDSNISISMDYEILSTTDSFFTLKLNCFKALGGGYEWNKFYTVDRITGRQMELKDLFEDGADYVSVISENILEQMKTQMEEDENLIYFLDSPVASDNFTQIKEDQNFYINAGNHLVIAFDEYEVAPGYMGTVEFEIPDEVLEPVRKN